MNTKDLILPDMPTASGADCRYYYLEEEAYKFWLTEEFRETTLIAQYHAYLNGLGPQPYEKLMGIEPERVDCWDEVREETRCWGYRTEWVSSITVSEPNRAKLKVITRKVYNLEKDASLSDFGMNNLGEMEDETPVIIDFGYQTFGFYGNLDWDNHLKTNCVEAYEAVKQGDYY